MWAVCDGVCNDAVRVTVGSLLGSAATSVGNGSALDAVAETQEPRARAFGDRAEVSVPRGAPRCAGEHRRREIGVSARTACPLVASKFALPCAQKGAQRSV